MRLLNALTPPETVAGIKGMIFDCDGVLFDSMGANRQYYNTILAKLGLGPMNAEQEAYVHAHAVRESLAFIVPKYLWGEMEAARSQVNYATEIMPYMKPEPGLYPVLEKLCCKGYQLAVNTNRTNTMEIVLDYFHLTRFFQTVVTARDVTPKPHPESVYYILEKWGFDPHEVVFVGDSALDARSAHGAGVRFWAYKNVLLHAELHIQDFWSMAQGMHLGALFSGEGDC